MLTNQSHVATHLELSRSNFSINCISPILFVQKYLLSSSRQKYIVFFRIYHSVFGARSFGGWLFDLMVCFNTFNSVGFGLICFQCELGFINGNNIHSLPLVARRDTNGRPLIDTVYRIRIRKTTPPDLASRHGTIRVGGIASWIMECRISHAASTNATDWTVATPPTTFLLQ